MRKTPAGIFFFVLLSFQSFSQLLSCTSDFPTEGNDAVTIIVIDSNGNHGLLNYSSTSDAYTYAGVITNLNTKKAGGTKPD